MELFNLSEAKQSYKNWILEHYSEIWKKTISNFQNAETGARDYMLDASSYLFKTGDVRWAVDPVYCAYFVEAPKGAAESLSDLDLVLLTHAHLDHFDTTLLKGLCQNENLVVGDEHKILFPGDIRNYKEHHKLPDFGRMDWLFAHLWLGCGKALSFNNDDLNNFCHFLAQFDTANITLGHLYEISRELEDYWTFHHAGMVMDGLSTLNPQTSTIARRAGQEVRLW